MQSSADGNNIITPTILKLFMKQLFDSKGTPINLLQDNDIEYGSNSNGEYWKFSNGLLIQRASMQKNIYIATQSGALYYDDGYVIQFPTSFIDNKYTVNVSMNGSGFIFPYSYELTNNLLCKFNLASPVTQSVYDYPLSWVAIGKWK